MVDYWAALPLGIAIGVAIIALCYMASQLFSSEGLKAYAKIELGEIILSVILVLIVLAAFDSVPGTLSKVLNVPTSQFGVIEAGQALHDSLEVPLSRALDALVSNTFRLTKIISYNYNSQLGVPGISPMYSSSPGAGASPLMLQLQTGMDTTSMTLLLVRGVRVAAVFLDFAIRIFLLPLAIFLRFVPPTRKIGGMLMGIALAVHLVFPAAVGVGLEMGGAFDPNLSQPVKVIDDPGTPPSRSITCSPYMATMYGVGEIVGPTGICVGVCSILLLTPWTAAAYPACVGAAGAPPIAPGIGCSGILGELWALAQLAFPVLTSINLTTSNLGATPDQISNIYQILVNQAMPTVVNLNLAALIIMVLALAATIVLARNFAQVLGGEGQFYGLVKLV